MTVPAIAIFLCDIDGCLTGGEGTPLDFPRLQTLAEVNRRHRAGEAVPAVTLCTGRPSPYVELMAQIIDCHLPCIYEHGCGLYDPVHYGYQRNPAISGETDAIVRGVKEQVLQGPVAEGIAFIQPGKEHSFSVYPTPGCTVAQVDQAMRPLLTGWEERIHLSHSVACLEVLPVGVDKGSGVRVLSHQLAIPLQRFAGIGDSPSDQSFLELVGLSATPANGDVGLRVDYRAKGETIVGVMEVLDLLVNGARQIA